MSDCKHGIPIGGRFCGECLDEQLDREWESRQALRDSGASPPTKWPMTELEKMRPVFDAAMAVARAWKNGEISLVEAPCSVWIGLILACEKAEEIERAVQPRRWSVGDITMSQETYNAIMDAAKDGVRCRSVFDAAMAWYEHFQTPNVQLFDRLTERLRDACRKAEDVERG